MTGCDGMNKEVETTVLYTQKEKRELYIHMCKQTLLLRKQLFHKYNPEAFYRNLNKIKNIITDLRFR